VWLALAVMFGILAAAAKGRQSHQQKLLVRTDASRIARNSATEIVLIFDHQWR
jgi:hypothetical protein